MKTLTGVIALMLALLFGASNVVVAAEKTATPAAPAAVKKTDKASPQKDGASSTKTICLVYKPGHQGDDRYCSQSVPAPN